MARLIISSPDGKNGILELNKPLITVGRGNANDLVLNDASVSRFHAVVNSEKIPFLLLIAAAPMALSSTTKKSIKKLNLKMAT